MLLKNTLIVFIINTIMNNMNTGQCYLMTIIVFIIYFLISNENTR